MLPWPRGHWSGPWTAKHPIDASVLLAAVHLSLDMIPLSSNVIPLASSIPVFATACTEGQSSYSPMRPFLPQPASLKLPGSSATHRICNTLHPVARHILRPILRGRPAIPFPSATLLCLTPTGFFSPPAVSITLLFSRTCSSLSTFEVLNSPSYEAGTRYEGHYRSSWHTQLHAQVDSRVLPALDPHCSLLTSAAGCCWGAPPVVAALLCSSAGAAPLVCCSTSDARSRMAPARSISATADWLAHSSTPATAQADRRGSAEVC